MAIQIRIVNGSYTEVYVGGGNFITETAPTMRHTFTARRMLAPGKTISDYREVTATEQAAIEAEDAAYKWPPQWFIEATAMYGVGYDAATGLFSLNGLTDITYPQMQVIWSEKGPDGPDGRFQHANLKGRTNLETHCSGYMASTGNMFSGSLCEIIKMNGAISSELQSTGMMRMFRSCPNLRRIECSYLKIDSATMSLQQMFEGCPKLEWVPIRMLVRRDLDFADSPLLSLEMLQYLLLWANNDTSKQATITVHPEVYAKLADETNTEWHPLMAQATAKQITFATTE